VTSALVTLDSAPRCKCFKSPRKHSARRLGLKAGKGYGSWKLNCQLEALLTGALGIVFVFGSPVAIVFVVFGFRYLRYVQRQKAIRLAIEKGMDPSAFLVESATQPNDSRIYLLRGLLWGLPGIVIGAGATVAGIQHGHRAESILGWIPAAIGCAYLLFYWWIRGQDVSTERNAHAATTSEPTETGLQNLKG
jgi:hypothetical protein